MSHLAGITMQAYAMYVYVCHENDSRDPDWSTWQESGSEPDTQIGHVLWWAPLPPPQKSTQAYLKALCSDHYYFSLHQRPPPAGQCGHHHTTIFADDCLIYCQIKSPKTRTSVNVISNPWRSGPKYGACASTLPSAQSFAPIAPRSPLFVSTLCVEKSCLNPRRPSTLIGVVISSDLLWEKQVNAISQKASNTLNFIRRNLKYCPQEAKTIAYNSLVRSTVEYCTSAWDPIMPRTLTRASESTGGLQDSFLETTARGAVSLPCSPNWAGSP